MNELSRRERSCGLFQGMFSEVRLRGRCHPDGDVLLLTSCLRERTRECTPAGWEGRSSWGGCFSDFVSWGNGYEFTFREEGIFFKEKSSVGERDSELYSHIEKGQAKDFFIGREKRRCTLS